MKNCVKNDGGVVKIHARQAYEESLALAVRHGKMTPERREELLAKIDRVACNDATVITGTESDIRVSRNSDSGAIVIDMVAHVMKTDEDRPDYMNVSYAAAKCSIENATLQQRQKAELLVHRIIDSSLTGMIMPGSAEQRAQLESSLAE